MDGMNNSSSMNMGGQGNQVPVSPDPRLAMMEQQRMAVAQQFASSREQVVTSVSPTPVSPTPTNGSTGAMRDRMRQNAQQAQQTQQVVLEQGENYKPDESVTVQQKPANTATTTIINTTNNGQVPDIDTGNDEGKPKFKPSKTMVFIIAGMVIVALIVMFAMLSRNKDTEEEPEVPTYEDPFEDPDLIWITPSSSLFYTEEEKAALRAAGYTGEDIDAFAADSIPAADKIAEAEAARDAWIQEAIAPLYDTTSDEFKEYIAQTWLTLPERTDMYEWRQVATYYTERKNLDYEKVGVYGNQLFIKVYLDDSAHDDWFFLCVTPAEWLQLNDNGNVIVNYVYCTRFVGDDLMSSYEDMENIFITSATLEIIN